MAIITIKVEDGTATTSVDAGTSGVPVATGGAGEGPAPTLDEFAGAASSEAADTGEGPPPMDLSQLGTGSGAAMAAEGAGPPPPDDVVEGGESDETGAPEPMPLGDLEKSGTKSTKSSRAKG